MKITTLSAAGLMLAGAAFAHDTGSTQPVAPSAAPGLCSATQLATIDQAFADASTAVTRAVAQLAGNPELPELRIWFGTTPAKFVRRNLVTVGDRIAQGRPGQTACNDARHCRDGIFAYAMPSTGAMGFCAAFFRTGESGQDSRLGIVVHEVSHIAIRTRDARYQPQGARELGKTEPATAAMNADSYEYFVESLTR